MYVRFFLDLILVMTVNPGFGGQAFIPAMTDKIAKIDDMIDGRDIIIEVDGGITAHTVGTVVQAGARALVAGSAIFNQPDYAAVISDMRARLQAG